MQRLGCAACKLGVSAAKEGVRRADPFKTISTLVYRPALRR